MTILRKTLTKSFRDRKAREGNKDKISPPEEEGDFQALIMDYSRNRSLLLKLLQAQTSEELERVVKEEHLDAEKWLPYGGHPNNVGTVDGQMLVAENALVEKITNSIDAILMRRCYEEGIDPNDIARVPQTMREAVDKFFDGEEKERSKFAKKWLRVTAEGEKGKPPTITIIDKGEGQLPDKIGDTILSLQKNLKARIRFVYGRYNQGGSSPLGFAGKNVGTNSENDKFNYLQLVLCRRAPTIVQESEKMNDNYDHFGFTIVRKRFDDASQGFTYEYVVDEATGRIFSFPEENQPIKIDDYEFKEGCVIKLYNYQLKRATSIVFKGLNKYIEKKLPGMPLPIFLKELRDYGGGKGSKEYTIFGEKEKLRDSKNRRDGYPKEYPIDLGAMGKKTIEIFVLDHKSITKDKEQESDSHPGRIFFVKDGLVLHTENMSWLSDKCGLPNLAPYIYAYIDIGENGPVTEQMRHTGREKFKNNDTTRFVLECLSRFFTNETFKKLDKEYGELSFNTDEKLDDKGLKKALEKEIRSQPELCDFFGIGGDFSIDKDDEDNQPKDPSYVGTWLPEKFDLVGENLRKIVKGSYGKASFDTGATDDLFKRKQDTGEWDWDESDHFKISFESIRNGRVTFRIDPNPSTEPPQETALMFYVRVPSEKIEKEATVTVSLEEKEPYPGKEYPTRFEPPPKIKIPVSGTVILRIKTDVENGYLDRLQFPGTVTCEDHSYLKFGTPTLKDGILAIRVRCLSEEVRDVEDIQITIKDEKHEFPLVVVPVEITPPATDDQAKIPDIKPITRDKWHDDTPEWNAETVARIPSWNELKEIRINIHSRSFEDLKFKKIPSQKAKVAEDILKRQICLGSILLFIELKDRKFEGDGEGDTVTRNEIFEGAIRAYSKMAVQNIKKLIR